MLIGFYISDLSSISADSARICRESLNLSETWWDGEGGKKAARLAAAPRGVP